MSTAIIYIRVSTDEQALTGYSMRSQEERLTKFCITKNIIILQSISEDHSAKNFHRPAWSSLMKSLNQNTSSRPDLLLFTRWDRFSRNTADAYYMISKLRKLGIEPQAIDQPLDMSIPENKVLMAMYIVTAEVENERRSLNVKYGIYRAKQEGRWMGHAPMGYMNAFNENGKKVIVPNEPLATLIKNVFESVDEKQSVVLLYRQSIEKGLRCSLNGFWNMIRNPVYCGKIRIPAIDGREAHEVKGNHKALIPEELFLQVQSRLKSRKKIHVNRKESDLLLLRGFLYCPSCMKRLSGSGSQGRVLKYYYYHCSCGYRTRADKVNGLFLKGINNLSANVNYAKLYKKVVTITLQQQFQQQSFDQSNLVRIMERMMDRAVKAKELLIRGEIDNEDYLVIKSDCESQIKIIGLSLNNSYLLASKLKHKVNKRARYLSNPGLFYEKPDVTIKRKVISLLVKDNLIFDEIDFYNNLNHVTQTIYGMYVDDYKSLIEENIASILMTSTKEEIDIYHDICSVENRKKNPVSKELRLKILRFMFEYAQICIKG